MKKLTLCEVIKTAIYELKSQGWKPNRMKVGAEMWYFMEHELGFDLIHKGAAEPKLYLLDIPIDVDGDNPEILIYQHTDYDGERNGAVKIRLFAVDDVIVMSMGNVALKRRISPSPIWEPGKYEIFELEREDWKNGKRNDITTNRHES